LLAALAVLATLAGPQARAAGRVEVRFVEPTKLTDAGQWQRERDRDLQELGEYLQRLGQRLPDGQTLAIEVLDVDLAGDVWPRSPHELRILRGRIDWPAIQLRYTLSADKRTVATRGWFSYFVETTARPVEIK
jgi:hypothetical protein